MKRGLVVLAMLGAWGVAPAFAGEPPAEPIPLAAPDTFGLGDQILHIPAAAFQIAGNATGYEFGADGYVRGQGEYFVAPLNLPAGSQVWALCTYYYNGDTFWSALTYLQAVKQAHGTTAPEVVTVGLSNDAGNKDGYFAVCTNFTYTYRHTGDPDHDGFVEEVAHQLMVRMSDDMALGGVRVFWRHQIGNPAAPSFSDVPAGDPAFQHVRALGAARITAGCAPGRYCPDAPWTRRQLALFLARALGLHWQ